MTDEVFKVSMPFERFDEELDTLRNYRRGETLSQEEAAKINSLPTLLASGHLFRLPAGVAKEVLKKYAAEVNDSGRKDTGNPVGLDKTGSPKNSKGKDQ